KVAASAVVRHWRRCRTLSLQTLDMKDTKREKNASVVGEVIGTSPVVENRGTEPRSTEQKRCQRTDPQYRPPSQSKRILSSACSGERSASQRHGMRFSATETSMGTIGSTSCIRRMQHDRWASDPVGLGDDSGQEGPQDLCPRARRMGGTRKKKIPLV